MTPQEKARELRPMIEKAATSLSDEDALNAIELYSMWAADVEYSVDERIRYNDILYRCVQAHTSQADWTPPETPALWVIVSIEEWPQWVQPTGAHDAYPLGAKVTHNDNHWVSTMQDNVFEPGVYGWDMVT